MKLDSVQYSNGFHSLDEVCTINGKDIFCAEVPIISSEFYNAGMQDIKASVSFMVDTESLPDGAGKVTYKGVTYVIYRRYPIGNGQTQLYCCERAGVRE
jgi:hypothetical protein